MPVATSRIIVTCFTTAKRRNSSANWSSTIWGPKFLTTRNVDGWSDDTTCSRIGERLAHHRVNEWEHHSNKWIKELNHRVAENVSLVETRSGHCCSVLWSRKITAKAYIPLRKVMATTLNMIIQAMIRHDKMSDECKKMVNESTICFTASQSQSDFGGPRSGRFPLPLSCIESLGNRGSRSFAYSRLTLRFSIMSCGAEGSPEEPAVWMVSFATRWWGGDERVSRPYTYVVQHTKTFHEVLRILHGEKLHKSKTFTFPVLNKSKPLKVYFCRVDKNTLSDWLYFIIARYLI